MTQNYDICSSPNYVQSSGFLHFHGLIELLNCLPDDADGVPSLAIE